MVVVCLSEPLVRRMSPRLERFASQSSSTTLTPRLSQLVGSCCVEEMSGSPCMVLRLRWTCLLLTCVYCCSLLVLEPCEQRHVWFPKAFFPQGFPYVAVLNCVGCFFLKSMLATQSGWRHLESEKVVCRGVAQSEACLVNRLDGVYVCCGRLKRSWLKNMYKMWIGHGSAVGR